MKTIMISFKAGTRIAIHVHIIMYNNDQRNEIRWKTYLPWGSWVMVISFRLHASTTTADSTDLDTLRLK
jgi:hypothetical protein